MKVVDRAMPPTLTPGTGGAMRGRIPSHPTAWILAEVRRSVVPERFRIRRRHPSRLGPFRLGIAGLSPGLRTDREVDVVGATACSAPPAEFGTDPFEQALADADWDDEPFTEDERRAVDAGLEAYGRGDFMAVSDVLRWLEEQDSGDVAAS